MSEKNIDSSMRERLREKALAAARNAYAPYSGFRVGAALLLTNGEIVTGCNVENASYGLTICAERTAMTEAVALYGPAIRLQAASVVNLNGAPGSPCGACRQFLAEFAAPEASVFFPGTDGEVAQTVASLLPFGFAMTSEKTPGK